MKRKPTRRDLLVVIAQLQGHIGDALKYVDNDRARNRTALMRDALNKGHELCVEVASQDPPTKQTGPWSSP